MEAAAQRTRQGAELSRKVAGSLSDIVDKAKQVDALAAEVAAACSEQSQGVSQITTAVTDIDKVTQHAAATAEESASAAAELSEDARQLRQTVSELRELVEVQAQAGVAAVELSPAPPAQASPKGSMTIRRSSAELGAPAPPTEPAPVGAPGPNFASPTRR